MRRRMKPAALLAVVALAAACTSGARKPATVVTVPIAGRPSALTVAGGMVWVADDQRGVVITVDATKGRVVGAPIKVGPSPIALAAGAAMVWVADASGTVTAIDVRSRRIKGAPVRFGTAALSDVTTGAGAVWVTDVAAGRLWRVDPSDRTTLSVNLPLGAVRAAVEGGDVWVTNNENTVTLVDARTLSVETTMTVGNGPIGLAPSRGVMWVANSDDNTVSPLESPPIPPRFQPLAVGKGPVAVTASVDGVWVVSQDDELLTRVDPTSARQFGPTVDLHCRPRGVAVGASRVWAVGVEPSVLVGVLV